MFALHAIGAALIYIRVAKFVISRHSFFQHLIGLIQDFRARRTLKKLLILNEQK